VELVELVEVPIDSRVCREVARCDRFEGGRAIDAERSSIQSALQQLDQALQRHNQWYDAIIRALVCNLPGELNDIAPDAHHRCPFGQWYYQDAPAVLRRHAGFMAIEGQHRHMHALASKLLGPSGTGRSVSVADFDAFARTLESLRLEIFSLRRDLENALYSLDELTGAGNRIGMLGALRDQQALVDRGVQSCCVVMSDIDHFKRVNDTWGHPAGDRVLAATARQLMSQLRPYDKLFRYGGEEFLLSLPDTDLATGHTLAERLRESVETLPISIDRQTPIHVTMSFGVARMEPGMVVEQAVDHADKAMYEAKRAGRNCTQVWVEDSSGRATPPVA